MTIELDRAGAQAPALSALDIERLDRLTAIVERTRRTLGRSAAQAMWPMLDLPDLPREPAEREEAASAGSFTFEGHAVRTVTIAGVTWFVGRDVAERLGYTNPAKAMNDHCRGVTKRYPIVDSLGRTQEVRVLNEADVMRLIMGSKLPAAQRFERWVFEVVLPEIRRTGRFGGQETASAAGKGVDSADTPSQARANRPVILTPYQERLAEVEMFFGQRCEAQAGGRVQALDLYRAYMRWSIEGGRKLMTMTGFGRAMRGMGFTKVEGKARFYLGFRVLPAFLPRIPTVR